MGTSAEDGSAACQQETAQSSSNTARNSAVQDHANGTLDAVVSRESAATYRHHSIRRKLGLHGRTPINEEHAVGAHTELLWGRIRAVLREPLAEFWGVFFMILFGNGSVAQVLLGQSLTTAPGADGFGAYQSISWGWGVGSFWETRGREYAEC